MSFAALGFPRLTPDDAPVITLPYAYPAAFAASMPACFTRSKVSVPASLISFFSVSAASYYSACALIQVFLDIVAVLASPLVLEVQCLECSRNRGPDREANGAEHERLSFKQISERRLRTSDGFLSRKYIV
jgi:hypothetical protein